jgi:hypothetical protein
MAKCTTLGVKKDVRDELIRNRNRLLQHRNPSVPQPIATIMFNQMGLRSRSTNCAVALYYAQDRSIHLLSQETPTVTQESSSAPLPQTRPLFPPSTLNTPLRMPNDLPTLIQLLQIPLLLLSQHLPPRLERLIHALHTREPNDRTSNTLVDPRKRDMAHLPAMLVRKLFHALDNLVVRLCVSGLLLGGLFLAFGALCRAE